MAEEYINYSIDSSFPQIPVRLFYFDPYPLPPILKIAVVACIKNRDYLDSLPKAQKYVD